MFAVWYFTKGRFLVDFDMYIGMSGYYCWVGGGGT